MARPAWLRYLDLTRAPVARASLAIQGLKDPSPSPTTQRSLSHKV